MSGEKSHRTLKYYDFTKNRGIAIITVAALLFVFLGFGSLVFDIGYLHIVKGELQNAADAGALAGAAVLYDSFGQSINPGANAVGEAAATANDSQNLAVEVFDALSNNGDVQRGHWSFTTRTFTPNPSLTLVPLWDVPTSELDTNTDFINAVRVRVHRQNIPAYSILSKIYGHDSFEMHAEAVAYIGYSGSILPDELDQPIAICIQSLRPVDDSTEYTCKAGRMINSGSDSSTNNTAAWTNFTQPCDTANPPTVSPYVCTGGNNPQLSANQGIGSVGGMQDNIYRDIRDCWLGAALDGPDADTVPDQPWPLKLPVVDCPGNNVSNCAELLGAVTVNVLFIKDTGTDSHWHDVPLRMSNVPGWADWTCTDEDGIAIPLTDTEADLTEAERVDCFRQFADHFNLLRADDVSVESMVDPTDAQKFQKTMFFLPDCTPHELAGVTGGFNTGVLAKIPVLVQ